MSPNLQAGLKLQKVLIDENNDKYRLEAVLPCSRSRGAGLPSRPQAGHAPGVWDAALGQKVKLGITSKVPQKLKGTRGTEDLPSKLSFFSSHKVFVKSKNVKEHM